MAGGIHPANLELPECQLEDSVFPLKHFRAALQTALPGLDAETGFKVSGQENPVVECFIVFFLYEV